MSDGGDPLTGVVLLSLLPLCELLKMKDKTYGEWLHHHNTIRADELRVQYNRARNQVRKHTRKLRRDYELNVARKAKEGNCKPFFSLARGRLATKAGVAPLLSDKNDPESIKYDDTEKSEILQRQFCGVFTQEPCGEVPQLSSRTESKLFEICVTEDQVLRKLTSLNPSKSCGPDQLHPRILKELANEITPALTDLFNLSLSNGEVPLDWRSASVSPIFKNGKNA